MAINISDLDIALRKNSCYESQFSVHETHDEYNNITYGVFYATVGDTKYVLFDELSVLAELVRRKITLNRTMFIAHALAFFDNIIKNTPPNWVEHTIELYVKANTVGIRALKRSDRYLMLSEAAEVFALNGYGYEWGAAELLHTIMVNACILNVLDSEETIYKNIDNGVITWNTTSEAYIKSMESESVRLFTGNKLMDDMYKNGIATIYVDWTHELLKDLSNDELALIANERVIEYPDTVVNLDENSPRELLLKKARIFLSSQFSLFSVNDKRTIDIIIKIVNKALQIARDTLEKHKDDIAFTLDEVGELALKLYDSLNEDDAYKILMDAGMENPNTVKINDIYNLLYNNIDLEYTKLNDNDQMVSCRSYLGGDDLVAFWKNRIDQSDIQIIPQDKLLNVTSKLRLLGKQFAFYIPKFGLPVILNKTDRILYTHSYENIAAYDINNIRQIIVYQNLVYSNSSLIVTGLLGNLSYYIEGRKQGDNKK